MNYIIKDTLLEIVYIPGKGAWTYHIEIPNTENLYVRWGYTKVSGYIDSYELKGKNLFSIKGKNKMLAVNSEIRKCIHKDAGDIVLVTLILDT